MLVRCELIKCIERLTRQKIDFNGEWNGMGWDTLNNKLNEANG